MKGEALDDSSVEHCSMKLEHVQNGKIVAKNYLSVWPEGLGFKYARYPIKILSDLEADIDAEARRPTNDFTVQVGESQYCNVNEYVEKFKSDAKTRKIEYVLCDNFVDLGAEVKARTQLHSVFENPFTNIVDTDTREYHSMLGSLKEKPNVKKVYNCTSSLIEPARLLGIDLPRVTLLSPVRITSEHFSEIFKGLSAVSNKNNHIKPHN